MIIDKDIFIKKYDKNNISDFNKLKFPHEFNILRIQRISPERNIYILSKKGFLGSCNIIGYAIISNLKDLKNKDKMMLAKVFKVDDKIFINHDGLYIEDFMIARVYRKSGIGTSFFMKLKTFFPNEDFLLSADGDGLWFWQKIGFNYIDKSKYTMVLTSKNN